MPLADTFGSVDAQKQKKVIKEIKCTCKECGKVWHYLKSEETSDSLSSCGNAMVGCGTCGSIFSPYYMNKSKDYADKTQKYKKCPACGSVNITKEEITHDI